MIQKFENLDLDAVMQIWLQANLDAHAFIPASFWTEHFEMVRDMLPQAELYVHENEDTRQIVQGFLHATADQFLDLALDNFLIELYNLLGHSLLAPFRMVCRDFILPEPASYVFFYALFNLRKLLYIIYERSGDSDALDTAGAE